MMYLYHGREYNKADGIRNDLTHDVCTAFPLQEWH